MACQVASRVIKGQFNQGKFLFQRYTSFMKVDEVKWEFLALILRIRLSMTSIDSRDWDLTLLYLPILHQPFSILSLMTSRLHPFSPGLMLLAGNSIVILSSVI
jgi:hypothetical protein